MSSNFVHNPDNQFVILQQERIQEIFTFKKMTILTSYLHLKRAKVFDYQYNNDINIHSRLNVAVGT